jgi:hypothetical protein
MRGGNIKQARMLCGSPMPDGMKENDKFPGQLLLRQPKQKLGMTRILHAGKLLSTTWFRKKITTCWLIIPANFFSAEQSWLPKED